MHKSNVKHKIGCNNPTFAQNWIDSAPNGKIHRQKFVILKGGNPEFRIGFAIFYYHFTGFVGLITWWENKLASLETTLVWNSAHCLTCSQRCWNKLPRVYVRPHHPHHCHLERAKVWLCWRGKAEGNNKSKWEVAWVELLLLQKNHQFLLRKTSRAGAGMFSYFGKEIHF